MAVSDLPPSQKCCLIIRYQPNNNLFDPVA